MSLVLQEIQTLKVKWSKFTNPLLDANKSPKEGVDALIGTMTGEEAAAPG